MIPGIIASRGPTVLTPSDPSYSSVVSLLHFNTGNTTANSFADQVRPWLWTANGGALVSSAQSKFGGTSLKLAAAADFISTPDNAALQVGSSDFTIECWIFRLSDSDRTQTIANKRDSSSAEEFSFAITTSNALVCTLFNSGSAIGTSGTAWGSVTADSQWHHVAACRSGSNLYLFIDGVLVGTNSVGATAATANVEPLKLGRDGFDTVNRWFNGYIDEFRFTKGVARYTASFTPPTAIFPESSNAILDDAWNPAGLGAQITLSNGNHTMVRPFSGNDTPDNGALSTRAHSSGKFYSEATMNRDGGGWSGYYGYMYADTIIANISSENYTNGMQIAPSRGFVNTRIVRNGVAGSVNKVYGSGVVVGYALDIDNGKAWVRMDNDWVKSDLTTTTTFDPNDPTTTWTPAGKNWRWYGMSPFSGTEVTINVGATAFARTPPPGFTGIW